MAKTHGKDARIYVNGYDLSAYLNDASLEMSVPVENTDNFASTAKQFDVAGVKDATFSASGLFDGSASAVDARFDAAVTAAAAVPLTYMWYGDSDGNRGYGLNVLQAGYNVEAPSDGVVSVSMDAESVVGPEPVIALHALAAETSSNNGTTHNNGAATSNGGSAYLHVTAFSATSLDVLIEGSATGSFAGEEVTLGTFTQATGVTSERITWTGTTHQHVRAKGTQVGSSVTYHVSYYRG